LIPSPIRSALSTIRQHQVAHLLMGGQACVLYGAAEFSRDLDLALLAEPANLERLGLALRALDAERIAVPALSVRHLEEGLAVHFRCRAPQVAGLRIDIMAQMRGVAGFRELWERRTTLEFADGEVLDVLSLPDLVAAKKTQRDKDWPMIRRLVDVNYLNHRDDPTPERQRFWLLELRTPELLVEVAGRFPELAFTLGFERPVLLRVVPELLSEGALAKALRDEEDHERQLDADYWRPRKAALEQLRHAALRGG
jgi:hypothetical protein